jgi:hypothetical protein
MAAKLQKVMSAPEKRKAISERRLRDWQDPAFREKLVGAHRLVASTPEYRRRRSEVSKARWADPETGEKMRAKSRENVQHAIAAVRGRKQTPTATPASPLPSPSTRASCAALWSRRRRMGLEMSGWVA